MNARIYLLEDNQLLRTTVQFLLIREETIELCGSAESAEEALREISGARPDLILVDGSLPGMNGFDFIRNVQKQDQPPLCLFLSGRSDTEVVQEALDAGACGYVVKGGRPKELLTAIHSVLNGQLYISPIVSGMEELRA